MTTGNISELSALFQNAVSMQAQATGSEKASTSFSQVMSQTEGTKSDSSSGNEQYIRSGAAEKNSEKGGSARAVNETGNTAKRLDDKAVKDPDQSEISDQVVEAAKEVIDTIKEELSVSDEDIQKAMEELSLTVADLFDVSAVTQLFTELSGAQDSLAILTDETLSSELSLVQEEVLTLTDQLKSEMGITDDMLQEALSGMKADENESSIMLTKLFETEPGQLPEEEVTINPENENADLQVTVTRSQDSQETGAEAENESELMEEGDEPKEHTISRNNQSKQQTTAQEGSFAEINPALNENIEIADSSLEPEVVPYTDNTQAREIARQIVEQLQVKVTEDTTSLEMQLNPASLGHVGLTIEAKNGVITASFTAQNEAVKSAIEGQMMVLQENLDKQGVKVEAVEVTIASHEFEQNLQKGNEQKEEENSHFEAGRIGGRRRRINLSAEEDSEEELSEEEALSRDMMIRNGNTVDFMA